MEEDYRVSAARSVTMLFLPRGCQTSTAQFEQYSGGHLLGTLIPKKAQIKAGETKQGIQESRLTQATRSEILHSSRIQKGWTGLYAKVHGSRSMELFFSPLIDCSSVRIIQ